MAQKIELDGKTFRIWFKHAQYAKGDPAQDQFIQQALFAALADGQIKEYRKFPKSTRVAMPIVQAATVCTIETNDSKHEVISTGYSFCSVNEKRFIKSDSRNRALGRAIGAYWKSVGGKVRVRS